MTKIHIGQEIKQEVQKQDLTIEDFAKNLHLASSEIENIFNKTSLETDLLLKISKLLKRDFFSLFSNYVIEDAYKEIISLLKQKGDKRYIAVPDWEDECEGDDGYERFNSMDEALAYFARVLKRDTLTVDDIHKWNCEHWKDGFIYFNEYEVDLR